MRETENLVFVELTKTSTRACSAAGRGWFSEGSGLMKIEPDPDPDPGCSEEGVVEDGAEIGVGGVTGPSINGGGEGAISLMRTGKALPSVLEGLE